LIAQANEQLGYDMKKSDNEYHFAFKSGSKSETRKYSEKMVDFLKSIKAKMRNLPRSEDVVYKGAHLRACESLDSGCPVRKSVIRL
jgi:hypothetical protein